MVPPSPIKFKRQLVSIVHHTATPLTGVSPGQTIMSTT